MSAPTTTGLLAGGTWRAPVRAGLEAMIAAHRDASVAPVAVFDFDETALKGDISETLLQLLSEEGDASMVAEYEAACRVDLRKAYLDLVGVLIGGRTEAEVRALALRALGEGTRRGRLAIRESMRELVWAMHRSGWEVWVVTASPALVVQPVAEQYGIHPARVLGMETARGSEGRYGTAVLEPAPCFEGKLTVLRAGIGRDPHFVAGDSRSDLTMMAAAAHALVVDRGDPIVREHAAAAGWWVQPSEELR